MLVVCDSCTIPPPKTEEPVGQRRLGHGSLSHLLMADN